MDEGWSERDYAPSLRAFWAAEAARRQGSEAFERFHLALGRVRHQQGMSYAQPETVQLAAEMAELDLAQFQAALTDPTCLDLLGRRTIPRRKQMDIFGTPTFAFPGARAGLSQAEPSARARRGRGLLARVPPGGRRTLFV